MTQIEDTSVIINDLWCLGDITHAANGGDRDMACLFCETFSERVTYNNDKNRWVWFEDDGSPGREFYKNEGARLLEEIQDNLFRRALVVINEIRYKRSANPPQCLVFDEIKRMEDLGITPVSIAHIHSGISVRLEKDAKAVASTIKNLNSLPYCKRVIDFAAVLMGDYQ